LADYFATGRYWSTWILAFTGVMLVAPRPFSIERIAIVTAVVPVALTTLALVRLRLHFGDSRAAAWRRVLLHQTVTHTLVILYFAWAVALWPRLIAMVRG
jgi:hypothetical protein